MNRDEVEGVLGHEITHVANGDMVTMTLIQGVVNAFVLFLARVIAFAVSQGVREEEPAGSGAVRGHHGPADRAQPPRRHRGGRVLALARVPRRSGRRDPRRPREDGRALERLRRTTELVDTRQEALATLKIDGAPSRFTMLFASHPPLEERIARLQQSR